MVLGNMILMLQLAASKCVGFAMLFIICSGRKTIFKYGIFKKQIIFEVLVTGMYESFSLVKCKD